MLVNRTFVLVPVPVSPVVEFYNRLCIFQWRQPQIIWMWPASLKNSVANQRGSLCLSALFPVPNSSGRDPGVPNSSGRDQEAPDVFRLFRFYFPESSRNCVSVPSHQLTLPFVFNKIPIDFTFCFQQNSSRLWIWDWGRLVSVRSLFRLDFSRRSCLSLLAACSFWRKNTTLRSYGSVCFVHVSWSCIACLHFDFMHMLVDSYICIGVPVPPVPFSPVVEWDNETFYFAKTARHHT
jgi:hypothetical protein